MKSIHLPAVDGWAEPTTATPPEGSTVLVTTENRFGGGKFSVARYDGEEFRHDGKCIKVYRWILLTWSKELEEDTSQWD